jgi:hypothetical protein
MCLTKLKRLIPASEPKLFSPVARKAVIYCSLVGLFLGLFDGAVAVAGSVVSASANASLARVRFTMSLKPPPGRRSWYISG